MIFGFHQSDCLPSFHLCVKGQIQKTVPKKKKKAKLASLKSPKIDEGLKKDKFN